MTPPIVGGRLRTCKTPRPHVGIFTTTPPRLLSAVRFRAAALLFAVCPPGRGSRRRRETRACCGHPAPPGYAAGLGPFLTLLPRVRRRGRRPGGGARAVLFFFFLTAPGIFMPGPRVVWSSSARTRGGLREIWQTVCPASFTGKGITCPLTQPGYRPGLPCFASRDPFCPGTHLATKSSVGMARCHGSRSRYSFSPPPSTPVTPGATQ